MAQLEALNNGYDTVIFLNNHGTVSEGPGSCLFIVRDDVLITPLITDSVLESITRDTIIHIAKEYLGLKVEERSVDLTGQNIIKKKNFCVYEKEMTTVLSVDKFLINKV